MGNKNNVMDARAIWMAVQQPVTLVAAAAVAIMGNAGTFRSGREFSAYIGLVPKHTGSGGKVRLLGISKRGDAYMRTLFIHGARAVTVIPMG